MKITYYKMKIRTIDKKIKQNKVQYDLDIQIVKMSAIPSGKIAKYEILTDRDGLPEKDLLEKATTIKRFEYLPLNSELKKQTDIIENKFKY